MSVSPRQQVLDTAKDAVLRDRNNTHGEPEDCFAALADFRKVWRKHNRKQNGKSHDAAIEELLRKIARAAVGVPAHLDNYADTAGYSACAYEAAVKHQEKRERRAAMR